MDIREKYEGILSHYVESHEIEEVIELLLNLHDVILSDEEISDKAEDYIERFGYKTNNRDFTNEYLLHSGVTNLMEWVRDKFKHSR